MIVEDALLPYQKRWVADPAKLRLCEKSRRVGLSWGEASEASLTAAAEKAAGGMDAWYIGTMKEMAQEFIRDAAMWARAYDLAAGEIEETVLVDGDKDIVTYRITFASGYRVSALSSRPSNLRGKQGLVIIDEAAFHHDLKGLLKAALALLMWGGRVCVISTHFGVDNPFNDLIQEIRSGKRPGSVHTITLDEALADGLFKRICLTRNEVWSPEAEAAWRQELIDTYGSDADEELFCIPSQGGGRYLSRALVESRMVTGTPVLRLTLADGFAQLGDDVRHAQVAEWLDQHVGPLLAALDPTERHYFGQDFARSSDLSVLAPLALGAGLVRRVPFLIEQRNVPYTQQVQILTYVVDRLPNFLAGALDARGNGEFLAERAAQLYGFTRIAQIKQSPQWYGDEMPKYKAALEDGKLLLPADVDLLSDHGLFQQLGGYAKIPDGAKTKGVDGKPRHGDAAMACVFAYVASNIAVAPIEFLAGGHRASGGGGDHFGGYGGRRDMRGW